VTAFESVLAALEAHGCKPKRRGKKATALCPVHTDSTPSLGIDVGDDGRALVYCFAGCPTETIVSALGFEMSDLFERKSSRQDDHYRSRKKREPTGPQDPKFSITPRFVTELSDARCAQLFSYLDLRQGKNGRFARGDQAIADALGWQARTVRVHALHLAGAGWIHPHKHLTETGAHKATEYEVIHNPARSRSNENATTPLRKRRARPRSRLVESGKLGPANRRNVARQTRDTSIEDSPSTVPEGVVRLARHPRRDVGRETRDTLGTQKGNQEKDSAFFDGLDPDGDVADASEDELARAPLTATPPTDDATLECLFADDVSDDQDWLRSEAQAARIGMTADEALAALVLVFPGAELITA
jgi:hypothetical protein